MTGKQSADAPSEVRCALYTRKSTEDRLEGDFNSLDAQREAAHAYIASQKHAGWVCLPEHYDDGGYTGANMERPALARLLEEIRLGKVDCVVVYKVDRLSRSLLDFARIMGVFEEHHVSFVSVTQQFNTATPMGRLTLNVLFSFAQFERETIAERTRDKMAAARRRGKWIGGAPVLGYDLGNGRLVVNPKEAKRVRAIFELSLEKGSVGDVLHTLEGRGWRTKCWSTRKGHQRGGRPFRRNNLRALLTNVAYVGKVRFQNILYEAEHEAIVQAELFDRVQTHLRQRGRRHRGGRPQRSSLSTAVLNGLLHCAACQSPMAHTVTPNGPRRYRYYVCSGAQRDGRNTCPAPSLRAADIEAFVAGEVEGACERNGLDGQSPWAPEKVELLRRRVGRVDYDGRTGEIAITLLPEEECP